MPISVRSVLLSFSPWIFFCKCAILMSVQATVLTDEIEESFPTKSAKHYACHKSALSGIVPPVIFSSTYLFEDANHGRRLSEKEEKATIDEDGFIYSRWGSPTNAVVCDMVSALEGATGGTYCFCSGMNAITTCFMTELKSGDHVIAPQATYGGTFEWLSTWGPRLNIEVTFVDATEISNYEEAMRSNTRLLYAESPSNPTMRLIDLQKLGALNISTGGRTIMMVDSTFATPYHVNALSFEGVDVVIHSATKYLGGHSDLTAGTVTSNNIEFLQRLGKASKLFGGPLPAMDSYLLIRGIKTLDVRMERHARNAMKVAEFLEGHPDVVACHYPGLKSHLDHELATRQFRAGSGYGGMLSFDVGSLARGKYVVENVKLVNLAVSLGAVESLIEHPASMTHAMVPTEMRMLAGITDGLIRLSVGLESVEDLIDDIKKALDGCKMVLI